jgi:hypothetical protein
MIKANFAPGSIQPHLDGMVIWLDDNRGDACWTAGKAISLIDGKVYLSSITFRNEEDFVYCSLKYGLVRVK